MRAQWVCSRVRRIALYISDHQSFNHPQEPPTHSQNPLRNREFVTFWIRHKPAEKQRILHLLNQTQTHWQTGNSPFSESDTNLMTNREWILYLLNQTQTHRETENSSSTESDINPPRNRKFFIFWIRHKQWTPTVVPHTTWRWSCFLKLECIVCRLTDGRM